jgi:hypothetical protein
MPKKILYIAIFSFLIAMVFVFYNLKKDDARSVVSVVKQVATKQFGTTTIDKKFLSYVGSSSCAAIVDVSQKQDCANGLLKSVNATATDACGGLASAQDQLLCQRAKFIKKIALVGDLAQCAELVDSDLKTYCVTQVSVSLAISKLDKKYCNNIQSAQEEARCIKTVEDSLASSSAVSLLDTDHDGHSDAEEIKQGFNPCGTGKLPSPVDLKLACAKYHQ